MDCPTVFFCWTFLSLGCFQYVSRNMKIWRMKSVFFLINSSKNGRKKTIFTLSDKIYFSLYQSVVGTSKNRRLSRVLALAISPAKRYLSLSVWFPVSMAVPSRLATCHYDLSCPYNLWSFGISACIHSFVNYSIHLSNSTLTKWHALIYDWGQIQYN